MYDCTKNYGVIRIRDLKCVCKEIGIKNWIDQADIFQRVAKVTNYFYICKSF